VILNTSNLFLDITEAVDCALRDWHCWLGIRKSIRPVKNWVMRCWHGCLSEARWFAYGQADAMATSSYLTSLKSRMVLPFWCWIIEAVLEKEAVKQVCHSGCWCIIGKFSAVTFTWKFLQNFLRKHPLQTNLLTKVFQACYFADKTNDININIQLDLSHVYRIFVICYPNIGRLA